jgi:hypothetical protein
MPSRNRKRENQGFSPEKVDPKNLGRHVQGRSFIRTLPQKTFGQIMYDEYNFTLENIAMFTGHSFERQNKSVLLTIYIDSESPAKKTKLFDMIAKGFKTSRT